MPNDTRALTEDERATMERARRERAKPPSFLAATAKAQFEAGFTAGLRCRDEKVDKLRQALSLARSIAECRETVNADDKAMFDAALDA